MHSSNTNTYLSFSRLRPTAMLTMCSLALRRLGSRPGPRASCSPRPGGPRPGGCRACCPCPSWHTRIPKTSTNKVCTRILSWEGQAPAGLTRLESGALPLSVSMGSSFCLWGCVGLLFSCSVPFSLLLVEAALCFTRLHSWLLWPLTSGPDGPAAAGLGGSAGRGSHAGAHGADHGVGGVLADDVRRVDPRLRCCRWIGVGYKELARESVGFCQR